MHAGPNEAHVRAVQDLSFLLVLAGGNDCVARITRHADERTQVLNSYLSMRQAPRWRHRRVLVRGGRQGRRVSFDVEFLLHLLVGLCEPRLVLDESQREDALANDADCRDAPAGAASKCLRCLRALRTHTFVSRRTNAALDGMMNGAWLHECRVSGRRKRG